MSILYSKEQDGTLNVAISGYVTKDAKVFDKVVLFSVCYNGKAKKYMDCKAWSDRTAGKIASCLEKHDEVMVFGIHERYTGKDGQARDQIIVDGIIPMVEPPAATAPVMAQAQGAQSAEAFSLIEEDDAELPF